ncbi:MAG: NDMA-dependent alcohol dehydrogenase [Acidimicrobiales bacterium]
MPVDSEAAILWEQGGQWAVEPVQIDEPEAGEVLVSIKASGMCHSDEHLLTGDLPSPLPVIGGHEGAGIVERLGPGVTTVAAGDHVVLGPVPACGQCPSCATGHSNLCDLATVLTSGRRPDGTSRHHARGIDLNTMCCLGTFARHSVVEAASCVKVPESVPFDRACLVGCGFTTGWGSAVHVAGARPGQIFAVVGVGGVGAAAIQGARRCGVERIFAVDPFPFKREQAVLFGATHVAASVEGAFDLIERLTAGHMCDRVICSMGVGQGSMMAPIMSLVAKGGRAVVTNLHPIGETQVNLSLFDLTLHEKQIVGTVFGSANMRYDIPKLLELYEEGQLDLDDMITSHYKLGDINVGYDDTRRGRNIRGVIVHD